MSTEQRYELGDLVYARVPLHNDGSVHEVAPDALLAAAGTRGVVIKVGSLDHAPEVRVYLVRFDGADGELGPPVGAMGDELTPDKRESA